MVTIVEQARTSRLSLRYSLCIQLVLAAYWIIRSYSSYVLYRIMIPDEWLKDVGNAVVEKYIRDGNDSATDMSHVKHEIIHRVATPKPYHLPPLQNPPQAPAAPHTTFIPPPQVTMQAPAQPMIITAPQAPQHIIQQIPHPIFQNLVPNQNDNSRQMFGKADFMEMMMMQNAQMHQMVMQQMMLSSLPGSFPTASRYLPVEAPRPAQSVHHHHYTTPAPAAAPPVVHHYTTMPAAPAADWGSSYPIRAYTSPSYYYYDDGQANYYVYH